MRRTSLLTSVAFPLAGALALLAAHCGSTTTGSYNGGSGTNAATTGGADTSGVNSGSTTGSGGPTSGSTAGNSGAATTGSSTSGGNGGMDAAATGSTTGSNGGGMDASTGGMEAATTAVTPQSLFGKTNMWGDHFDDSFFLFPCYGNSGNQDCLTWLPGASGVENAASPGCPHMNDMTLPYELRGRQSHEYFQVGGEVGKHYLVTIKVEGVSEAKYYMGGMRPAGEGVVQNAVTLTWQAAPEQPCSDMPNANDCLNDTFYIGGAPVDFEFYNVYKLVVYNPPAAGSMGGDAGQGSELQHYYLNSFPKVNVQYETHLTYFISYTHQIVVPGGGVLEYHSGDTNCRAIDNCAATSFANPPVMDCPNSGGRSITGLQIPSMYQGNPIASFNTHGGSNQPFHSHVIHVRVSAVQAM